MSIDLFKIIEVMIIVFIFLFCILIAGMYQYHTLSEEEKKSLKSTLDFFIYYDPVLISKTQENHKKRNRSIAKVYFYKVRRFFRRPNKKEL